MSFFKKLLGGQSKSEIAEKLDVPVEVVQEPTPQKNEEAAKETLTVSPQQIELNIQVETKEDVLRLISQNLSSLGLVRGDYLQALVGREEKVSTYLINGVAIPHGVNEAKDQVVRTGVFIVQVPQGVLWNEKGDVARLIVGIAAKGKDHLDLLQRLTEVVTDEVLAERLATTTDKSDILSALNDAGQKVSERLDDFPTATEAKVADEQGMHARPASLISEQATKFAGTDIRIRHDLRSATAKSVASLLSMGASKGDVLVISAEGPEAEQAVQVLAEMINNGLDNDQEQNSASYQPLTVLSALQDVQCRKTITGSTGLHIMFPMIGRMLEWPKARDIAESVRGQLNAPSLPLGIMIEVPSAVMIAGHLAKEVDFFSIGSNDLTQYTLAIDRMHSDLCCEADSCHPALVKMIEMTVKAAQAHGKWVGMCGNAAASPNLATLLVGLGVSELSVSPANVGVVKNIIRAVHYTKLQEKANKALQMESSEAVMELYSTHDDLF